MAITYTPSVNFGAKDSLPTNDPDKVIKGSEFSTEFVAIQTAFGLAAPAASPTFTGTVTISSVDINGGTIDGVTIGGSSAGAITGTTGQFNTSLNVDGTVTADGLTVDGVSEVRAALDTDLNITSTAFTVSDGNVYGNLNFISEDGSLENDRKVVSKIQTVNRGGSGSYAAMDFYTSAGTSTATTLQRMRIDYNGDISFYEDTGTTPKFFWDASAEALGIGTTSPLEQLYINSASGDARIGLNAPTGSDAEIKFSNNGVVEYTIGHDDATDNFVIGTVNVDSTYAKLSVDKSGNVGIGTSIPNSYAGQTTLTINSTGVARLDLDINDAYQGYLLAEAGYIGLYAQSGNYISMGVGGVGEAMRLDGSGNLLVGKTSAGFANTGHQLNGGGSYAAFTRDGATPVLVNRKTSDGAIVEYMKDGNTVGSIGNNTDFYIASQDGVGLRFTSNQILPCSESGATQNGSRGLGSSSARFKDLYLSDGVYLGGTGAANLLDDYEEGTWTPTYSGSTTTGTGTYTFQHGSYTKVGNVVTVNGYFRSTGHTGTGQINLNLPFQAQSGAFNYGVINVGETYNLSHTADRVITGYVVPNAPYGRLLEIDVAGTSTTSAVLNMDTGFDLLFTVTYRTA